MKPVQTVKKWYAVLLLATMSVLQGCIQDDLSDCGIGVRYIFEKNVEGVDKFASSVDRISLFVFDGEERFVGLYSDEGEALKSPSYVMTVPLRHGSYKLVAWGNLYDDYDYTQCVPGTTTMQDFLLSLKCRQDTSWQHPVHLFYGAFNSLEVEKSYTGRKYITVEMMKNTNTVHVINQGLPLNGNAATANENFHCIISSVNGSYKIDNSITGNRITYIPQYTADGGVLQSDFVIMRELNDGSTGSTLQVVYRPSDGTPEKEIFRYDLTSLLVPLSITGDLDIDDEFTIHLAHDYTTGNVTITIKDWVIVVNGDGDIIG